MTLVEQISDLSDICRYFPSINCPGSSPVSTQPHRRDPVSAPAPEGGGESEPSLYVELLNRGVPGAEHLSQCPCRGG